MITLGSATGSAGAGSVPGDPVGSGVADGCCVGSTDGDGVASASLISWRSSGPAELPKMPVPGVGWLAYCTDSEGNVFGMMQMDETAA